VEFNILSGIQGYHAYTVKQVSHVSIATRCILKQKARSYP